MLKPMHLEKRVKYAIQCSFAFIWLLTSCTIQPTRINNSVSQPTSPIIHHEQLYNASAVYLFVDFNEMANHATAIFVGKITGFPRAQWNQDSGEYWDDTKDSSTSASFVVSYTTIEVQESIIDSIGLEKQVQIPSLSESYILDEKLNVVEERERPHHLSEGDRAIFFIKQTNLAWRGGTRQVLYMAAMPTHAYFKQGEDGLYRGELLEGAFTLDELKAKILAEREKPAQ